jgi:hypothetical protein
MAGSIQALVGHCSRYVVNAHAYGIAKEEQLDHGHGELYGQSAPIAEGLDEFLLDHGPDT